MNNPENKVNPSSSKRILIAEDSLMNQKIMQKMLQKLGYSAEIVDNGERVLEHLDKNQYHIIFMDISMPKMDGWETTQVIKEKYGDKSPILIAMSAHTMEKDRRKSLSIGMDEYIVKPVTLVILREMLEKYI